MGAPAPPAVSELCVRDVDVHYGNIQVLFGVSLIVHAGEVLALVGTNGAGKSTLLRAICGVVPLSAGEITYGGATLPPLGSRSRARDEISLVCGGRAVFRDLTVEDNLKAGGYLLRRDRNLLNDRIGEVLALFPALTPLLGRKAGLLSGGEQQMLALGKGLLVHPRLLLIDELSLGLAPVVVGELLAAVDVLRANGISMLIVEQSLNIALHLSDRAVFLEKGAVRFEGSSHEMLERDDIARAVFLGASAR